MTGVNSHGPILRPRLLIYKAVCTIIFLIAPISAEAQNSPSQVRSPELEIYAVALEQIYIGPETKILLISDSTTSWWEFAGRRPGLGIFSDLISDLPADLIARFATANSTPSLIQGLPNVSVPLEIQNRSEEELGEATDPTLSMQYPDATGILELTLPGISSNGEQALLHVVFSCGPRCGGGKLIYLVKEEGCWVVKQTEPTWTF